MLVLEVCWFELGGGLDDDDDEVVLSDGIVGSGSGSVIAML